MHRLEPYLPRIRALCRAHRVDRLWVFGSVLRADFRPDSDIDFLYELDHAGLSAAESNAHFFALADGLRALLQHPVDLIWHGGIRNPYFKEEVEETGVEVYARRGQDAGPRPALRQSPAAGFH
ncbi:MAG: nucleotidyltransferase domain-containing protein [Bacteroidia bacterium]|nr:nucleotidyltransferase domain-containing protein [Bacteroidia bacterium]